MLTDCALRPLTPLPQDADHLYFLLESARRDLWSLLLVGSVPAPMCERRAVFFFAQLVHALSCVHAHQIAHRCAAPWLAHRPR